MSMSWAALKQEAINLAKDVGVSGREHHSLAKHGSPLLATIRVHGIPAEHREWVWPILLHSHKQKLQRQSSNYLTYTQLMEGIEDISPHEGQDDESDRLIEHVLSSLSCLNEESIEKQSTDRFIQLDPIQERKIKRILLAYTKAKDAFYYCHGMVEICTVLSTFLTEEDTFWSFRLVLEVLLPKYHEDSIMNFQVDCLVLEELIALQHPALSTHLQAMGGVTVQVLCTKWFFSLFAEAMPFDVICRLYDILLIDIGNERKTVGSKILFSTASAVFLYLSEMIMELMDPSVVVDVMSEFCATTLQDYSIAETFLDFVLFVHDQMEDQMILNIRAKYRSQLENEQRERMSIAKGINASVGNSTGGIGKSQSIKLIIQWKNVEVHEEKKERRRGRRIGKRERSKVPGRPKQVAQSEWGNEEEDVRMEWVTTPTQKEVLMRLQEGIGKINRRRSRTASLRNIDLLSYAMEGSSSHLTGPKRRAWSSSCTSLPFSPALSSSREYDESEDESEEWDETVSWTTLRDQGKVSTIIEQSSRGVPDEHRRWVWPLLLNQVPRPKSLPKFNASTTEILDTETLEPEVSKAIEQDLTRTRSLSASQIPSMRRVLRACAIRNRRVGYCQGMNEIVAVLLRYLNEQDALLGLLLLLERSLPAYHVDSMIGLHTDCAVMNTLLGQNDGVLHTHLQQVGLNMEILCTKWLVTCYLTSLPPYCGYKVMDMLLSRISEPYRTGSRVLLGVGLALFFTMRQELLQAKDAGEVLMAINEYFANEMEKTDDELIPFLIFCEHIMTQLQPKLVQEYRNVHQSEVLERFATFEAKKIEMRQQMEGNKRRSSSVSDSSTPPLTVKVHRNDLLYQRVESTKKLTLDPTLIQTSMNQMEQQLEQLQDMYQRGKIDDVEYNGIKTQIYRKTCKTIHSPQSMMTRVQALKEWYVHKEDIKTKKPNVSFYGRMKKVKKNAIAIFKATFE